MNQNSLTLSTLPHTWILDADGTLCVHNGYPQGEDKLLPGVKEFFASLPKEDMAVVLITSRRKDCREAFRCFLQGEGVRFNHIIYGAPMGERILVNGEKPSGLCTAYAISKQRDAALEVNFIIDKEV